MSRDSITDTPKDSADTEQKTPEQTKISFYFCNAEKAVAATLTMLGCSAK